MTYTVSKATLKLPPKNKINSSLDFYTQCAGQGMVSQWARHLPIKCKVQGLIPGMTCIGKVIKLLSDAQWFSGQNLGRVRNRRAAISHIHQ